VDRLKDNVRCCDVRISGISFSKGVAMNTLLCACGGKCEGLCCEKNLHRVRTSKAMADHICPAAYEKPKKREYHQDQDEE
jgi:hypothetical protein